MKKNVLVIGPSIDGNGGISSVIKSYTEAEELNKVIEFISSYKDGSKIKKIIEFIKGLNKCLYRLIFNKDIEIVHIHSASRASFKRKLYFFRLSKLFNKKVILHIHGAEFMQFYEECNLEQKNVIKKTMISADMVIALSSRWKNDLIKISQRDNVKVIYNPVLVDRFNKSYCNEDNLIFMGRVGKRKGIYDLLEIMPKIIHNYPNVKLYICGDGDIDNVKQIILDNKLDKNIYLLGWISGDEKLEILSKSSINILPSYNEGLPVSILEAMSTGIPTIATNIAGIPEEIENGKNGYLIEVGDKDALYNSIIDLLENPELRKKMGNASLIKVKKYFDISVIEKQLLEIYKKI